MKYLSFLICFLILFSCSQTNNIPSKCSGESFPNVFFSQKYIRADNVEIKERCLIRLDSVNLTITYLDCLDSKGIALIKEYPIRTKKGNEIIVSGYNHTYYFRFCNGKMQRFESDSLGFGYGISRIYE